MSSVGESGTMPAIGWRPTDGLKPVRPHSAAGTRTEPAVSVPMPATAHAVGDGDGRARGRAAGNARGLAVIGVARRVVMRVEADAREGELAHVGLGDDDGAGRLEVGDGHGVGLGGRGVGGEGGAGPRGLALDGEEVLDRHGHAGQRRQVGADGAQPIDVPRRLQGALAVDGEGGARAFALHAGGERGLGQRLGRHPSVGLCRDGARDGAAAEDVPVYARRHAASPVGRAQRVPNMRSPASPRPGTI